MLVANIVANDFLQCKSLLMHEKGNSVRVRRAAFRVFPALRIKILKMKHEE